MVISQNKCPIDNYFGGNISPSLKLGLTYIEIEIEPLEWRIHFIFPPKLNA
jgi:hypothetical protein